MTLGGRARRRVLTSLRFLLCHLLHALLVAGLRPQHQASQHLSIECQLQAKSLVPTSLPPASAHWAAPPATTAQLGKRLAPEQPPTLVNLTQFLLDRFGYLFAADREASNLDANASASEQSVLFEPAATAARAAAASNGQLETRASIALVGEQSGDVARNFVRVANQVFSRVILPGPFRRAGASANSTAAPATAASVSASRAEQCAPHIGCIDDLPNFPQLLKLKLNVSASFTVYTRHGPRGGLRVAYEPLVHHQLEDGGATLDEAAEAAQQQQADALPASGKPRRNRHASAGQHRKRADQQQQQQQQQQKQQQQQQQLKQKQSASSWLAALKIARSQELPFDLAALERSRFDGSQETRVIIGGYFAKEDEEWIDELVHQWLELEPRGNVIKVSWQDSNRGLYHTAAHNSRIVGRQLSLLLHYLDELFAIDLGRFHLVGHSLGAHIAGFVGADVHARLARITGLDPAGPMFVELNASMRLDPSDAQFVDVLHTNGGPITKGALGLSTPLGHVDYYCNGGSLQPGCYFSSVTKSIMDPVERIACNHRRSYRYFTELIRLAALERRQIGAGQASAARRPFPRALLFREPRNEAELARLAHPQLALLRRLQPLQAGESLAVDERLAPGERLAPPLARRVEFHLMRPERQARGLYLFRTRAEAPFFGARQYALTLTLPKQLKRKISLYVKLNTSLVAELELDELSAGANSFLLVVGDARLVDERALGAGGAHPPDLWLMWRPRSFNLLLAHHQAELQLLSAELTLVDNYLARDELDDGATSSHSSPADDSFAALGADGVEERLDSWPDATPSEGAARQRRRTQVLTIRYGPEAARQRDNAELVTVVNVTYLDDLRKDDLKHPNGSQRARPLAPLAEPALLARNHWHRFADGRLLIIETQVV